METVWRAERCRTPGGQPVYSDLAITVCLTLGVVYKQPRRQTEGYVRSPIQLMGVDICVPDYSTFSRRGAGLSLPMSSRAEKDGSSHLVVDNTGLKIFGMGEWLQNKHKTKLKRKSWCKLHLGLDLVSGDIVCSDLTKDDVGDPTALPELLDQIDGDVIRIISDGADDGDPTSNLLTDRFGVGVEIIPASEDCGFEPRRCRQSNASRPAHCRHSHRWSHGLAGKPQIQSAQPWGNPNGPLEDSDWPQTESAPLSQPENRGQDWHPHPQENDRACSGQV